MDNKINTDNLSWSVFEKTGSVEVFLEYSAIKRIKAGDYDGDNFPKGHNNQRS